MKQKAKWRGENERKRKVGRRNRKKLAEERKPITYQPTNGRTDS